MMETKIESWIYFKFQDLPQEIRDKFDINSTKRLDCVKYFNPSDYKGLTFFVNGKGQLFFYRTNVNSIVKADPLRQATYMLVNKSINLSSIYSDLHRPGFGYGNPPHARMLGLKKNKPNPLFPYKDDLFIFLYNPDYTIIELIIIPNAKNLWNVYYLKIVRGDFDSTIESLRAQSKPFFEYGL